MAVGPQEGLASLLSNPLLQTQSDHLCRRGGGTTARVRGAGARWRWGMYQACFFSHMDLFFKFIITMYCFVSAFLFFHSLTSFKVTSFRRQHSAGGCRRLAAALAHRPAPSLAQTVTRRGCRGCLSPNWAPRALSLPFPPGHSGPLSLCLSCAPGSSPWCQVCNLCVGIHISEKKKAQHCGLYRAVGKLGTSIALGY